MQFSYKVEMKNGVFSLVVTGDYNIECYKYSNIKTCKCEIKLDIVQKVDKEHLDSLCTKGNTK